MTDPVRIFHVEIYHYDSAWWIDATKSEIVLSEASEETSARKGFLIFSFFLRFIFRYLCL